MQVKRREKGDVIGAEERSRTDKKRERRKKKNRQRCVARGRDKEQLVVAMMLSGPLVQQQSILSAKRDTMPET